FCLPEDYVSLQNRRLNISRHAPIDAQPQVKRPRPMHHFQEQRIAAAVIFYHGGGLASGWKADIKTQCPCAVSRRASGAILAHRCQGIRRPLAVFPVENFKETGT
ncbi:MAG: hypothetical protein AAAB11_09040, partial [Rhizobium giardinii]